MRKNTHFGGRQFGVNINDISIGAQMRSVPLMVREFENLLEHCGSNWKNTLVLKWAMAQRYCSGGMLG